MKVEHMLDSMILRTRLGASTLLLSLGLAAIGCGGGASGGTAGGKVPGQPVDAHGQAVSAAASTYYKQGLAELERLDRSNGWNEQTCAATSKLFLDAADEQGDKFFAPAYFNAAAVFHRCGNRAEARKYYGLVLEKDAKFHQARVPLALFDFADSNETALDKALAEMNRAVNDSEFQNVEALVHTARLQMRRNSSTSDQDGPNDFERAKKNLQRALAVDDGYMPAFNQLAIYYLEAAKKKAGQSGSKVTRGAARSKVDTQALDLALLVSSQAVQKNPGYGPIYNTLGLTYVEMGDLNRAVESFNRARKLDPSFFEAHMNAASVNLQFRGFAQAEEAYRAALKVKPNDYDAHLGLALAVRGSIDDSNFDARLKEAESWIEKAKALDPNRPEAYFNHAILTQGFKAKSGGTGSNAALEAAKGLFQQFVAKAQGKPEFADAIEDVKAVPTKSDSQCIGPKAKGDKACKKGRIKEIDEIIEFNKQSEADRKKMEEEMKNQAAMEEAAGGSEAE